MAGTNFIERFFGRRPEGIARLRMGRGVLGNTTYAFWGACAAVVGISFALRSDPISALVADGAVLVVYLLYLMGTYRFADKHPDRAMLGDTEWLKWSLSQQAAREVPEIPQTNAVIDPRHQKAPLIEYEDKSGT